jgi:hypothetical protein
MSSLLFEGLFWNQNGSYAIARSGFECTHYDLIHIYGFMIIKFVLVGTFFPRLNVGRWVKITNFGIILEGRLDVDVKG